MHMVQTWGLGVDLHPGASAAEALLPGGIAGILRTEQPAWACSPQCSWCPSWGEPLPCFLVCPCLPAQRSKSQLDSLDCGALLLLTSSQALYKGRPRSMVFLSRLDIGRSMPGLGTRSARPARTWRLLRAPAPQEGPSHACSRSTFLDVEDCEAVGTPHLRSGLCMLVAAELL